MSQIVFFSLRTLCLVAVLFEPPAIMLAQSLPKAVSTSATSKTVSEPPLPSSVTPASTAPLAEDSTADSATDPATDPATGANTAAATELATELATKLNPETFQLPVEQHKWARFQPGAGRKMQTVSETFSEAGNVMSRSVTTQQEVLEAVAEGKYVLRVQATVDLAGSQVVGDWKTRVLHIATDGAGPLADSRRLEDQRLPLAGRDVELQVWEIRYRSGARNLTDRVYYNAQRFPFVVQRETFTQESLADSDSNEVAVEAEQRIELVAVSVPFLLGQRLLECSCLRTLRRRAKGDTMRLTFTSSVVPGGEVAVWSTDFDAQGRRVGSQVAQLLDYGDDIAGGDTAGGDPPVCETFLDETPLDSIDDL